MQIDHCLILAAGFGTRMGAIGQKLPKVMWPVFEKPLLELQVAYARSLGVKNIFINLHYMGKEIHEKCLSISSFEGVQFLWEEPEILDIGGAIHNLSSLPEINYSGNLLVLNADQFFYLQKAELYQYLTQYQEFPAALFSYAVDSSLGYNALEIGSDRLVKNIVKNQDLGPGRLVETYTGISFIKLSELKKTPGKSAFFDSVCPYKVKDIPAILLDKVDYWDFGTLKRYWETSFKILKTYRDHATHPFLRFLVQEKALKTWKINLQEISYNAKSSRVINLNPDKLMKDMSSSIIVSGNQSEKTSVPTIWWNGISEEVKS
jgi:NDP-sugar pyrophosphorylase family protein